ncbi:two-component system, OmpR family, sensor histidine kinase TctE [Devosia lucknowensis]|uniref:histidine kinase n=1 Tax=Devosia lucknowensis TaxID=1096929 RepID=A0A1Y6F520_9HYPH|nr:sensor histidine kinase [Devosia lucknowensis]SMQ68641.1 two-component system, OmpR family, sensor histidine kinase TctE [Devosia lucknowensis]
MSEGAAHAQKGRRLALTLALWILPAVMLTMGTSLWMSATTIVELSDSAYDRSLAGAVRAIDANISTESGGVGVELPYNLFSFFQLTAQGRVYFNVSTDDGLVQIGDVLLPPTLDLSPGEIRFHDGEYFGETIRIGALRRPLDPTEPAGTSITIQVAETKSSRNAFQNTLIERAILRDVMVVAALVGLLTLGVFMALRPLRRLRDEIDRRASDDLKPIAGQKLPAEVRPLVEAVNRLMNRRQELADLQRRFLDDASHQLRTPMAVLRTQIDLALHDRDVDTIHETLRSSMDVLDRSTRTTTQLLTLARTQASEGTDIYPQHSLEFAETVAEVIRGLWPKLRARRMECEFHDPGQPVWVRANRALLEEAVSNLLDNAINYAPRASVIDARLTCTEDEAVLQILDEGPGMAEGELANAGIRFRRGSAARNGRTGSGLGLAIAQTALRACGGTIKLANREDRSGLSATIRLPIER